MTPVVFLSGEGGGGGGGLQHFYFLTYQYITQSKCINETETGTMNGVGIKFHNLYQ